MRMLPRLTSARASDRFSPLRPGDVERSLDGAQGLGGAAFDEQRVAQVDQRPRDQVLDAVGACDGDGAVGVVQGFRGLAGVEKDVAR